MPEVVAHRGGIAVEGRQILGPPRKRAWQASAGIHLAEQNAGQCPAALHARIPEHEDGGGAVAPRLHDDRASRHHGHHGAGIGRGHRLNQCLVLGAERQAVAVAAGRECGSVAGEIPDRNSSGDVGFFPRSGRWEQFGDFRIGAR